jgi:FkbM family methyltransferase
MVKKIELLLKAILPESIVERYQAFKFHRRVANFRPYLIKKRVDGIEFDFWVGDILGRNWYDSGPVGCTKEMIFIRNNMIKPGDTVLECGAHHGFTTLLLAERVGPEGKIVAFEASKHNFDILAKNIELNKLSNVTAYNYAVGRTEGQMCISSSMNSNVLRTSSGDKVKMVCLDRFKDENPNFLKIDVEGYEAEVLKGAQGVLDTKPKIEVEVHTEFLAKYNTSTQEILDLIRAKGYEIWIKWTPESEPKRYDNEPIKHRVHLFAIPTYG